MSPTAPTVPVAQRDDDRLPPPWCRAALEEAGTAIAVLELDGKFREANPAFCELTGFSREQLLAPSIDFWRLSVPEEVAGHHHYLERLGRGDEESYRQPSRILRRDGVRLWVDLVVNPLRQDDELPSLFVLTAVDITEQKRAEDALHNMSFHDALTGLANRRLLQDRLQTAIARARREKRSIALLFIDLDEFKPVNDNLGHQTGDWLLKSVALRLSDCLRGYDSAARFGGDEFVALLSDLAHPGDAMMVAERIRSALADPFVTDDGKQIRISCSIGLALYPDHAVNDRDLLHACDEAMYVAKQAGRNRIVCSERTPAPVTIPPTEGEGNGGLVYLRWEARYACGNPFIDAEHRELFRQANHLLDLLMRPDARPSDVRSCLDTMMDAVKRHFGHEERLMAEWHFPDLENHAAKHRRLLEHADQIARILDDRSLPTAELLSFLAAEIIYGHILSEDRAYFHLVKP